MTTPLTKARLSGTELSIVSATKQIANKLERTLLNEVQDSPGLDDAVARITSRDILIDLRPLTGTL
ncbi:MAG: hypothetical protein ACO39Y_11580, partial [Ilumatobacteraceae bacterium]